MPTAPKPSKWFRHLSQARSSSPTHLSLLRSITTSSSSSFISISSSNISHCPIQRLNPLYIPDILRLILVHLHHRDLYRTQRVCRLWNDILSEETFDSLMFRLPHSQRIQPLEILESNVHQFALNPIFTSLVYICPRGFFSVNWRKNQEVIDELVEDDVGFGNQAITWPPSVNIPVFCGDHRSRDGGAMSMGEFMKTWLCRDKDDITERKSGRVSLTILFNGLATNQPTPSYLDASYGLMTSARPIIPTPVRGVFFPRDGLEWIDDKTRRTLRENEYGARRRWVRRRVLEEGKVGLMVLLVEVVELWREWNRNRGLRSMT